MTRKQAAKPFPWRCPRCLGREVRPVTIEHTSQVKHDGRLHEITLRELVVPKCPACGELVFCNDTEEQVSRALRDKLGLLQPDAIRSRRKRLGLTQKALANCIGVAQETISRWESGLLIQARAMNTLLRVFFDFPDVRLALGEGLKSLDLAGNLSDWASMAQSAPVVSTGAFVDSVTCFPWMFDVQPPVTAMFEVPVASQGSIAAEVGCEATPTDRVSAESSLRIAA
ncbi:MAG TPA: type II TA system antitoxin MqsA family protein [Phycisphaerae bacterium]|nr:type II TA system antitoxin MqsA family protein [Phycisphaerae bacterium]